MDMDERKLKILQAIIQNYMETGEPVGSRTISKYTDLNLSSATIRNEMSDLEDMGYILQPHTSAGRIPSDKGYRLYVDTMLEKKDREVADIKDLFLEKTDKLETVLKQVARLLSENTNYTTLVSKPKYEHKKVKFTQLSMVSETQLLVIIVIEGNIVKDKFVNLTEPIEESQIPQINFLLNTALDGLDLTEINMALIHKMKEQAGQYAGVVGVILDAIAAAVADGELNAVITGAHLLHRTVAAVAAGHVEVVQRVVVFRVARVELTGPDVGALRLIVPALACVDRTGQEEPLGVAAGRTGEQALGHVEVALIDGLTHLRVERGVRAGIGPLAAVALAVGLTGAACTGARLARALAHDRIVSLVDLLHACFCQVGERIIDIVVRMILARKLTIGAFYIVITRLRRYTEYLIGIHAFPCLRSVGMCRRAPVSSRSAYQEK